jgi:hypothetical protein
VVRRNIQCPYLVTETLCRIAANNQDIFSILSLNDFHMCPYAHGKTGNALLI